MLHARGDLRRQDPERREAGGPAGRAADQIRAGAQPQDCQGARPHHPAGAARPRRRGDRMRRVFVAVAGALLRWRRPRGARPHSRRAACCGSDSPGSSPWPDAFERGMSELGYMGKTITSNGGPRAAGERLPRFGRRSRSQKPCHVPTTTGTRAIATECGTATIPIVIAVHQRSGRARDSQASLVRQQRHRTDQPCRTI